MNGSTVVHPDNGILFNAKKKWAIRPWKDMKETSMWSIKLKEPIWKGYCMIPTIWHFAKGKTMVTIKRSVVRFWGAVKLFCTIIQRQMDIITHLSKPLEHTTAAVNRKIGTMDAGWQWRVSAGPSVVTNVHSGAGCWQWGQLYMCGDSGTWELSVLPVQFCWTYNHSKNKSLLIEISQTFKNICLCL